MQSRGHEDRELGIHRYAFYEYFSHHEQSESAVRVLKPFGQSQDCEQSRTCESLLRSVYTFRKLVHALSVRAREGKTGKVLQNAGKRKEGRKELPSDTRTEGRRNGCIGNGHYTLHPRGPPNTAMGWVL